MHAGSNSQHRFIVPFGRLRSVLILALASASVAGAQASTVLTAGVIAGGGGTAQSPGKCLRLDSTVGQPLTGLSSGGAFSVQAGFLPGNGNSESIFHSGFEVCT